MFNYSDIIRKDPSTIKILSFHLNKHSFVISLQQQFLEDISYYLISLNYTAVDLIDKRYPCGDVCLTVNKFTVSVSNFFVLVQKSFITK